MNLYTDSTRGDNIDVNILLVFTRLKNHSRHKPHRRGNNSNIGLTYTYIPATAVVCTTPSWGLGLCSSVSLEREGTAEVGFQHPCTAVTETARSKSYVVGFGLASALGEDKRRREPVGQRCFGLFLYPRDEEGQASVIPSRCRTFYLLRKARVQMICTYIRTMLLECTRKTGPRVLLLLLLFSLFKVLDNFLAISWKYFGLISG